MIDMRSVGSTTFGATSPGFAHLNLAGPWSAANGQTERMSAIRIR
jgi:hypothetical protein